MSFKSLFWHTLLTSFIQLIEVYNEIDLGDKYMITILISFAEFKFKWM